MEELKKYMQSVLFGDAVEDIQYLKAAYRALSEEEKEDYSKTQKFIYPFGDILLSGECAIKIREIVDDRVSIEVRFRGCNITTGGGIYLCEFESFTMYYNTTI